MDSRDAAELGGALRATARLQAMASAAMIRALGMQAANQARFQLGESLAYDEAAFEKLIDEHGLGWNQIVEATRG